MLRKIIIEGGISETMRKILRVCFVVLTLSIINYQLSIATAQQRNVIAGLENNTEYRALIDEEGVLLRTADSIAARIASLRRELRSETSGREAISAAIVEMEERSFEIRSGMARLASRINTIEQEWILASLSSPGETETPLPETSDGGDGEGSASPNLVYNTWFASRLSPGELDELRRAQDAESELPRLMAQYREGHAGLAALAREYALVADRERADSLKADFDSLISAERILDERIGMLWEMIFDSKSYFYNDKEDRRSLLSRFEEGMERLREERSKWQEQDVPAALLDYVLQKRMLTDYEIALADEIASGAAADSLRMVAAALPGPASLDDLVPVALKERLFLDYADVTVGGSPYNAANPIPEVAVWPKGVIWRVQVGNFASPQATSVFRGAHPLAVQTGDDGRFRYFAGGFPTDSLAGLAVEQLRKAGFRAPSAVVWMDGVLVDQTTEGEKTYRVDISGVEELSPALRGAIDSARVDIVRTDGAFVLTPLDGAAAVRLRSSLEALGLSIPEMEAKLSIIPE